MARSTQRSSKRGRKVLHQGGINGGMDTDDLELFESYKPKVRGMDSKKEKNKKLSKLTKESGSRMDNVVVTPQTPNQHKLWENLQSKVLNIVSGPAGSGKTYLTAYAAAMALRNREVLNIFITRTMVTVGKDIGHLPGNEMEKMLPYVAPIMEYFSEFFGKEEVGKMLKAGVIRVVPVGLLRGYTFKDTFVIVDEAQNTTPHEFKTILTRVGENSQLVVLGDLDQSDLPPKAGKSGPHDFILRMKEDSENIGLSMLTDDDVLRSELVKEVLAIYKNEIEE